MNMHNALIIVGGVNLYISVTYVIRNNWMTALLHGVAAAACLAQVHG